MADHRGRRLHTRLLTTAFVGTMLTVVVLGGHTTGAYLTASRQIDAGSLSSGTLDVRLNAQTSDDVTISGFGIGDMLPGDSRAATAAVSNASASATLRFTLKASAATDLGTRLQVQVWQGTTATATNAGSTTTGYSGTCSGTQIVNQTTLGNADVTLLNLAASNALAPVAVGGSTNLCFRVTIPNDTPATAQGKSAPIVFTLTARSVS